MLNNPLIRRILEEQKQNKYTIYCDMDGVLTDFDESIKNIRSDIFDLPADEFWDEITNAGSELWEKMKWQDDGKKLWNFLKDYDVRILTGLPGLEENDKTMRNASNGKKKWIKRELGEDAYNKAILTTSEKKKKYANPSSILIDDREKNINAWKRNRGIGIIHKSAEDTIEKIKKLFKN